MHMITAVSNKKKNMYAISMALYVEYNNVVSP